MHLNTPTERNLLLGARKYPMIISQRRHHVATVIQSSEAFGMPRSWSADARVTDSCSAPCACLTPLCRQCQRLSMEAHACLDAYTAQRQEANRRCTALTSFRGSRRPGGLGDLLLRIALLALDSAQRQCWRSGTIPARVQLDRVARPLRPDFVVLAARAACILQPRRTKAPVVPIDAAAATVVGVHVAPRG
jgi:hypothetical protein